MSAYQEFLARKAQNVAYHGFEPLWMPTFLFGFQQALVDWALRKGRAAIFADCGLGKTPMQLAWAENVVRHTNKPVLILAPLAVSQQTIREAEKFAIGARRSAGEIGSGIHVTNYEKLHLFRSDDFSGVVCDESSAIKAFDGKRRAEVTEFMRKVPYRLLCTATAAPNDYIELGTSSEALGELGYVDMLNRFFVNTDRSISTRERFRGGQAKWRFKGHAQEPFWKWVCSWARAVRKPSDLGFRDDRFRLPALNEREHIVETRTLAEGALFAMPAADMHEEREERRRTIQERCEAVAKIVAHDSPAVVWCHLNAEADLLAKIIPGAAQVSGAMDDGEKEAAFDAFSRGQLRVLVIKPKIGAWGLNWQHCAHVVTFATHSYEQYYQAVRRCWRFGQEREVTVDIIATEGELFAKDNMRRKAMAADRMFERLVTHMNGASQIRTAQEMKSVEVPAWL